MIDLKAKPFCLSEAREKWVYDTLASMTPEEKEADLDLILREVERSDNESLRAKKDIMVEIKSKVAKGTKLSDPPWLR